MSEQPDTENTEPTFFQELEALINRHSKENASNTPDFILAEFMEQCLLLFDQATNARSVWFGLRHGADEPVTP